MPQLPTSPSDPSACIEPEIAQAESGDVARTDTSDVVGNLVDLDEGEILLPSFVLQKPEGLFVDLERLDETPQELWQFVTVTFASGAYFKGIDYPSFQTVLFDPAETAKLRADLQESGLAPQIRFAASLARIPDERKPLYRAVKTPSDFTQASYLFEPLILDRSVAGSAEDGSPAEAVVSESVRLDFDEFVAHLWNRGVRYGLLEAEVRARIADDQTKPAWMIVARQTAPSRSKDAEIAEVFDKLHRDRSPSILWDGKADLRRFKNTFPQIGKGMRLVRKLPGVAGAPGRDVAGFPIRPNPPKDIDLSRLAGAGIEWEAGEEGEFLVSGMDGYVNIDTRSQQFFITERLVNREGIGVRTTGSLDIVADQFEEHGDVEQGFSVTGHSIRVKGNVFGGVISKGGVVKVRGNVLKGQVRNADGPIEIGGFASHAHIESTQGEVRLSRAENSVIRARTVVLDEIRNCIVVGDTIEIGSLQNCLVGGKAISVGRAGLKPGLSGRDENVFVLEVPDLADLGRHIDEESGAIAEAELAVTAKKAEFEKNSARYGEVVATPAVRSYLENAKKVKEFQAKGGVLTAEQSKALAQLRGKVANELAEIAELSAALRGLGGELESLELSLEERRAIKAAYEAQAGELAEGVVIRIESVAGMSVVRKRRITSTSPRLLTMSNSAELRRELDSLGSGQDRVFEVDSGTVDWVFEPSPEK
ncbi:flagellar assembly protein A [Methylococcus sp. EFPC2]|uniref:flagellar assembly protein A n=1 Tax=Methylococcus sp. EFPC2 TaxID=2812648 RepID=UPI001966EF75|nr:flagellar assembly protein A [Methylococcus sp. EFPC2]QSA97135.1 DUF342 domain-containing protein [Methylococcus sp. EFPC2]